MPIPEESFNVAIKNSFHRRTLREASYICVHLRFLSKSNPLQFKGKIYCILELSNITQNFLTPVFKLRANDRLAKFLRIYTQVVGGDIYIFLVKFL
jgi:hypothetical protein